MDWNREQGIGERMLRTMATQRNYIDSAEIERLKNVEARCIAIVAWLEKNRPEVFRDGLWDAIAAAKPAGGE